MKFDHLILLILPVLLACDWLQEYSNPAGNDIHMGDPFVLLDDHAYYLYGTTGGKGFRIWRSNDFTTWEDRGFAFLFDSANWGKKSFWAPEVLRYNGRYYMTYSSSGPVDSIGFRLCLAISDNPEGPFRDIAAPWVDLGWSTIDTHIFVDHNIPYLFFDKVGVNEDPWHLYGIIYMVQLSPDLLNATTDPVEVISADQPWEAIDPDHPSLCNEGAFVFKKNGIYYLTYSAGHYLSPKYAIGYATADSPLGPWTKAPDNPIVSKNLSLGISGPGHNSVTWSPDGEEMFMVYHVHDDPEDPGADRRVFIDRLYIDSSGKLILQGPTTNPQPVPSGSR